MLRRSQQPTQCRQSDRRPQSTSRRAADGTGYEAELGGGGASQREAGPRRNPPLRTRLYPPIGPGAQRFTNPPSLWKRSRRAVQSWANGWPRYRLLGTGILDPNGSVAGQSGSWIVPGRGTSAPGSTSDWSPPAADPGLLGGASGRQQRWVSPERGHWWRRRWAAGDLLWSQPVRCCLLGCGPQVACITIGRKTHFIGVLLDPPGPTESEIQGWALGDC